MARKRRSFTPSFKAKVALEALKEVKTIAEIAQKHNLHPTQINLWKKQLLEGAEDVFPGGRRRWLWFGLRVFRRTRFRSSRSLIRRIGPLPRFDPSLNRTVVAHLERFGMPEQSVNPWAREPKTSPIQASKKA